MILAQITDLHLLAKGRAAYDRFDSAAALAKAIDTLNALEPRPDAVVISGDIAHHGLAAEYQFFLERIESLEIPCFPMVGNHDSRIPFRNVLGGKFGHLWPDEFIQFAIDLGPAHLIALDTLDEGMHTAAFCEKRLALLRKQLAAAKGKPVVLAMHQPPFNTGIRWLDGTGSGWAEGILEAALAHGDVRLALCGHVHRAIERRWAGGIASVCPSTAYQVKFDLDMRANFVFEPPAIRLAIWRDDDFVNHLIPIGDFGRQWEVIADDVLAGLHAYMQEHGKLPKNINDEMRGSGEQNTR